MPGSIDNVVVKIASRCNLNCSYCYVYNHEDKSYLDKPKFISDETFDLALARIRDYCERRDGHAMGLTFHGGEPTLVGARRFDQLVRRAKAALGTRLKRLAIQTNAVLIDGAWADVLATHGVSVGISLDGPADIHDQVRVDHAGRGSHAAAIRGLRLLRKSGIDVSVLCVINPGRSGRRIYEYFRRLGVAKMDFLLPDVSHDSKAEWYGRFGPAPVAEYLLPVFEAWMREDSPQVRIRVLADLLRALMGGSGATDAFGNPRMGYLIVETDGSIEALDALRVCEDGMPRSGLDVRRHGFDDLKRGLPLVHRLVHEGMPLPKLCRGCPERAVCGGGYLPHRYSRENGFDNPSVWCADILKLIARMRQVVEAGRIA